MQDTVTESEDRVPVLGAIPLLGNLFKSRSGSRQKSNLLVFLRPKILRDQTGDRGGELERNTTTSATKQQDPAQGQDHLAARREAALDPAHRRANLGPIRTGPAPSSHRPPQPVPAPQPAPSGQIVPQPQPAPPLSQPAPRRNRPRRPTGARTAAPRPRRSRCRRNERRTRTSRAVEQRKLSFPFAKRHGVLVRGIADQLADTVCRPGVTPQALAEVRRFVGVPLRLERVSAEKFDALLRIAYEAGSGATMQMLEGLGREHRSRASRRGHSRILGPARERRRGADHPADQCAADAGGQGERLGHPYRALREPPGHPLPRRRRAARGAADQAGGRTARGLAHQGHVQARHRRAAPAAGRHASPCASPGGPSTCASRPSPRATASAWCCVCSTSRPAGSSSPPSAWIRRTQDTDG